MDATLTTRKEILIQYEIDLYNNRLIEAMRKLLDETRVATSKMEKSQIGNLLEVATSTGSVELVKNFIQYQMGRDVGGTSWRAESFGDRLVKLVDGELKAMAETITDRVARGAGLKLSSPETVELTEQVWIQLLRQFIGQMNRYFYYQKEAQRWSRRES